jgi:hypothetical protein
MFKRHYGQRNVGSLGGSLIAVRQRARDWDEGFMGMMTSHGIRFALTAVLMTRAHLLVSSAVNWQSRQVHRLRLNTHTGETRLNSGIRHKARSSPVKFDLRPLQIGYLARL